MTPKRAAVKPHYSLDCELEGNARSKALYGKQHFNMTNRNDDSLLDYSILDQQHVLHKAGTQLRNLVISSGNNNTNTMNDDNYGSNKHHPSEFKFSDSDMALYKGRHASEEVDRPSRLERSAKQYYDDTEALKSRYDHDLSKAPVRRVDSGPSPARRDNRFDSTTSSSVDSSWSSSNVEVFVSPNPSTDSPVRTPRSGNSAGSIGQQMTKPLGRRDLMCRSAGEEINSNYQSQYGTYQNIHMTHSPQHNMISGHATPYNSNQNQFNHQGQPQQQQVGGITGHEQEFAPKGFYVAPKGECELSFLFLFFSCVATHFILRLTHLFMFRQSRCPSRNNHRGQTPRRSDACQK